MASVVEKCPMCHFEIKRDKLSDYWTDNLKCPRCQWPSSASRTSTVLVSQPSVSAAAVLSTLQPVPATALPSVTSISMPSVTVLRNAVATASNTTLPALPLNPLPPPALQEPVMNMHMKAIQLNKDNFRPPPEVFMNVNLALSNSHQVQLHTHQHAPPHLVQHHHLLHPQQQHQVQVQHLSHPQHGLVSAPQDIHGHHLMQSQQHQQLPAGSAPTSRRKKKEKLGYRGRQSNSTKEKKFSCQFCDFRSATNYNVTAHVKSVHLKEKEYSCEHCDFKSSKKWNLKAHIKTVHDKLKDFNCSFCDYKSSRKDALLKHGADVHKITATTAMAIATSIASNNH